MSLLKGEGVELAARGKKQCAVCLEAGDGAHFGAEACRACAAFFRRSVANNKIYVCRNGGNCTIKANVRCMCRACRFQKCIAVGMQKTAVQRHHERSAPYPQSCSMSPETPLPSSVTDEHFPILSRMHTAFRRLQAIRETLYDRPVDETSKGRRLPRAICYKDANKLQVKNIHLLADMVGQAFDEFASLSHSQKKLLFRHAFVSFGLLECGYLSMLSNRLDILVMENGDYIDCNHPETFYNDPDGHQLMSSDEAVKLFASSFDVYRRNIVVPLSEMQITNYEFYALFALILWDIGVAGQTQESVDAAKGIRARLLSELSLYYRGVRGIFDHATRIANLMLILPSLQVLSLLSLYSSLSLSLSPLLLSFFPSPAFGAPIRGGRGDLSCLQRVFPRSVSLRPRIRSSMTRAAGIGASEQGFVWRDFAMDYLIRNSAFDTCTPALPRTYRLPSTYS